MVFVLAQQAGGASSDAAQQQPQGGQFTFLFMVAGMILIWWFLVLGPQRKADKARRAKLDALKKGDRIRTRGGIEGVVARVQDDSVFVRIDTDGKVQVQIAKPYVDDVISEESPEAEEKK